MKHLVEHVSPELKSFNDYVKRKPDINYLKQSEEFSKEDVDAVYENPSNAKLLPDDEKSARAIITKILLSKHKNGMTLEEALNLIEYSKLNNFKNSAAIIRGLLRNQVAVFSKKEVAKAVEHWVDFFEKDLSPLGLSMTNEGHYDETMNRYAAQLGIMVIKIKELQEFIQKADEFTGEKFYKFLEKTMENRMYSNVAWAEGLIGWIDSGRECSIRTLVDDLIKLSNRGEEIHAQVQYGEDLINHIYDEFIVKWTDSDTLVDTNQKMGTFEKQILKFNDFVNEGKVKDEVKLTDEVKADILKDFKRWSGGYEPRECPMDPDETDIDLGEDNSIRTYLRDALKSEYAPIEDEIEEWFIEIM